MSFIESVLADVSAHSPSPVWMNETTSVDAWRRYLLETELEATPKRLWQFIDADEWKNNLILTPSVASSMPLFLSNYVRNLAAGIVLYFLVGSAWSFWIYRVRRDTYFARGGMPTWAEMEEQMWVSLKSLVGYALMPTMGEWLINRGFTFVRYTIDDMGGFGGWLVWTALYLFLVEFFIYWIHRLLHDIKFLYDYVHYDHHIYTSSLSPFAALAFNPLDGMLQAAPYVFLLLMLPVHYWTFEVALFATAFWTINIHDSIIIGPTFPIMGSPYHSLHHTKYTVNYGQYLIFWDWVFGTLLHPDLETHQGSMQAPKVVDSKKKSK